MIHKKLKIDNKEVPYHIPENWGEVSFKQFLGCVDEKDDITRVSILTGIDKDFFQHQELVNHYIWLESKLSWSSEFKDSDHDVAIFKTPEGLFYFPEEIELKSIGAYKDIQLESEEKENHLEVFPFIVSAYYVIDRDGEYDYQKAKEMISYFESQPCTEVILAGSFFLNKLQRLRSGTNQIQNNLITRAIKYLQGMIRYLKSLVLKLF